MGDSNIEAIYDLVCSSKEELQKVKEEIKKDKELQGSSLDESIIKKSQIKRDDDEDDDDDE